MAACRSCCGRLADLLRASDPRLLGTLWKLEGPDALGDDWPPQSRPVLNHLETWDRGSGRFVPVDPAEGYDLREIGQTHHELAVALLEAGIAGGAFAEAVIALPAWPEALGVLFHPSLARPGLAGRLRELIFPH